MKKAESRVVATPKRNEELFRLWFAAHTMKDGDKEREYADALIRENPGLFHYVVRKCGVHQTPSFDYDDQVQVARIAFLNKLPYFNPEKSQFTTFFVLCMQQQLWREAAKMAHIMKLPVNSWNAYAAVRRKIGEFENEHDRPPTPIETEVLLRDLPPFQIVIYNSLKYVANPVRLDRRIDEGDKDSDTMETFIAKTISDGADDFRDWLFELQDARVTKKIIGKAIDDAASPRDADIIRLYFGLTPDGTRYNISQIAEVLGVSRQAVDFAVNKHYVDIAGSKTLKELASEVL